MCTSSDGDEDVDEDGHEDTSAALLLSSAVLPATRKRACRRAAPVHSGDEEEDDDEEEELDVLARSIKSFLRVLIASQLHVCVGVYLLHTMTSEALTTTPTQTPTITAMILPLSPISPGPPIASLLLPSNRNLFRSISFCFFGLPTKDVN